MSKKEMQVFTNELQVGDDILFVGIVKATTDVSGSGKTAFAYESYDGELCLESHRTDLRWDIERPVKKPDFVSVKSLYGSSLVFEDSGELSDDEVNVSSYNEHGNRNFSGLVFNINQLTKAIRQAKGLEI